MIQSDHNGKSRPTDLVQAEPDTGRLLAGQTRMEKICQGNVSLTSKLQTGSLISVTQITQWAYLVAQWTSLAGCPCHYALCQVCTVRLSEALMSLQNGRRTVLTFFVETLS